MTCVQVELRLDNVRRGTVLSVVKTCSAYSLLVYSYTHLINLCLNSALYEIYFPVQTTLMQACFPRGHKPFHPGGRVVSEKMQNIFGTGLH